MKPTLIGYASTQFGELWEQSLYDLVRQVVTDALEQTGLKPTDIDAVFYGNMLAGVIENNLHATAMIAEILGTHIPVYRTEAACASGGMAFQMGYTYLQAQQNKTVLVIGAEKMTDIPAATVTRALSAAASGEEQAVGMTFPGLYGMLAQTYLTTYGYTEEDLAAVAVKNHFHATKNPKAHFPRLITVEQVLASPLVAAPLKVLDSSPISDGAAAVVLTNDSGRAKAHPKVTVASSAVATDTVSLAQRRRLDGLDATKHAAAEAFAMAGLTPADIQVAELHDCFTIAEVMAMEDIGFWESGTAGARLRSHETQHGTASGLVVNTSGGLKASGHPVGATGIKQLGELYLQLTGQAEQRQVDGATTGLAQNVGGSGGTAVVTILQSSS
jgi:acetyl-CoA C-acetyltransferase